VENDFQIERCEECVDLLVEYLDGTLPAERASALELHLSKCMPCITFVRTYKATTHLCHKKLVREMPPELVSSLQSFLEEQIPGFTCAEGEGTGPCPSKDGKKN
jgi:anti-sigma factor RsiW